MLRVDEMNAIQSTPSQFGVNFIRRPFCHVLMQAEALRLLKQADFQEINVKDTMQPQDLPLYFSHSCLIQNMFGRSHETDGWKLKDDFRMQDVDGLSLLDHAALGGMRMLSPRRGLIPTRRTSAETTGRHDT